MIKLYQYFISPLLGTHCRFYPSCSTYTIDALEKHGLLYGCFLSLWRTIRCNPLCKGGIDLIPEKNIHAK